MNYTLYLTPFILAFIASLLLTPIARTIGLKLKAYVKEKRPRDLHQKKISRLGGVAIFLPLFILSLYYLKFNPQSVGILISGGLIILIFLWDDFFGMSWKWKLFWQMAAAIILIYFFGVKISYISEPLGIVIYLSGIFSFLFTLLWLVGLMNVINFLDGLDGLAAGVSAISFFVLFLISLKMGYPLVAFLSVILLGSVLGFLPYNFNPAKIFLGDAGAYFLGFSLASLAILAEGKIATLALVLGLPILDSLFVVLNRILQKKSPFLPDSQHLHHRLLELGFSQRQIVFIFYFICSAFGLSALVTPGRWKLLAFFVLFLVVFFLVDFLVFLKKKKIIS